MVVMPDDLIPEGVDTVSFAPVLASETASSKLREDLLATWIAVTNAGGSVGFTAPADRGEVAAALDAALERVAAGRDALGVVRRGDASVGMGLLVDTGSAIQRHWRTLLRVMVRPELQGTGGGRLLVEGLHQMARDLGLEQLQLTVRGGERLESFYERFGYVVVGRHPGAVRVTRGDDRDEVMMVAWL
jgi:GNAT superfamily N-acetyltransferase